MPNEVKQDMKMAPHWSAQTWVDVLAKGGGQKKRFQYCLKPDEPERLLYLRTIQGHSGRAHSGNAPIDPVLQDNVLLPMNFTKYVDYVGHGNELRSTVRNGLGPEGFSTKTGRYAVFFTVMDPMDDKRGLRETFCDLSQAGIAPYQNTWKHLQNTLNWCKLLPTQERGLRFDQTRSNAVVLYDTLPAEFMEKAVCIKTGEQLHQRESERPRIALKAHSRSKIILGNTERSANLPGDWMQHRDYRIPGISLSTVQEQDERKRQTVAKLIEKFESHKYKEQFLQDMSETQKMNRFSEASQSLLRDMNQTEIFELCENT